VKENEKTLLAFGLCGIAVYLLFTQSGKNVAAAIGEKIMQISDSGLSLIAGFEGFSAVPYTDADGQSIAFGHFLLPGELGVTIIPPLSKAQGYDLLNQDAASADAVVSNNVTVPLTQNQHDALCSLVYNIGGAPTYHFENSTLLRHLNAGDYNAAADQFLVWNKSQGQVDQSLVDRRAKEQAVFLTA
jgi:lysozyme